MKLNQEIRDYFKQWQQDEGVYKNIDIDNVEFEIKSLKELHQKENVKVVKSFTAKDFIEISDIDEITKQYDLTNKIKPNLPVRAKQGPKGTILVSRVRPLLGSYTIVKKATECFTTGDLIPIILNDSANIEYVFMNICSLNFKNFLIENQDTNGQKPTITDKLYSFKLILPVGKDSKELQVIIVEFIEYYKSKFSQYRQLITELKSKVETFDKAFLPAIFSAEKDPFIVEYFDQWSKKKQHSVSFDEIKFAVAYPFKSDNYFSTNTPTLGLSQKDIVKSDDGYPVYTGKKEPICYSNYGDSKLINAMPGKTKISFATDGDSSAGTNFVIHNEPFYVNATRMVLEFKDNAFPIYFFYALLKMKEQYGFNYTRKANMTNLIDVFVVLPEGESSFDRQKIIVEFIEEWRVWRDELYQRIDKLSGSIDLAEEVLIAKTFKGSDE